MPDRGPDITALTASERAMVKKVADQYQVSEEEAATMLAKEGLARRVKKRTGKSPAKVYSIKRKL